MPKVDAGPYFRTPDGAVEFWLGDAAEQLRAMPAGSAHCCITSPPYWGLRDYKTGSWVGGDSACDHDARQRHDDAASQPGIHGNAGNVLRDGAASIRRSCACGAKRIDKQLGSEPSPSCDLHGFMKLREGLSDEELQYVMSELRKAGVI